MRRLCQSLVLLCTWGVSHAWSDTPMPYYSAAQALQSLYAVDLPARANAFAASTEELASSLTAHCQGTTPLADPRQRWTQALLRWNELATPAMGPVLSRRSHRHIDFWPSRPELIAKALARHPANLEDLERIGTPAKGLPALEILLSPATDKQALNQQPDTCHYATLLAQEVAQEAQQLQQAHHDWAERDWSDNPELTGSAMAEWVNQWLAALEKLRWLHMEKPIRSAQGKAPAFPRLSREINTQEWLAQWRPLYAQAALTPAQRQAPPQAGQSLIPIEALLLGKGHVTLAQRWHAALDHANRALLQLSPGASTPDVLACAGQLKMVSALFQTEVAAALDIPLGFSDADGD